MRSILLAVAILATGCIDRPTQRPSTATTTTQAAKRYTREEFRQLAIGKTGQELIDAIGRPETTSEGGFVIWVYKKLTYDPITGKTDADAMVLFDREGRVESVRY